MMKNCIDPILNGLIYWAIAYGISVTGFEDEAFQTEIFGFGDVFVDSKTDQMGSLFAKFAFRLSIAAIATTIVSGNITYQDHLLVFLVIRSYGCSRYVQKLLHLCISQRISIRTSILLDMGR